MPVRFLQLVLRGSIPLDEAQALYDIIEKAKDREDMDSFHTIIAKEFILKIELDAFKLCLSLKKDKPQSGSEIAKRLTKNGYSKKELQTVIDSFHNQTGP